MTTLAPEALEQANDDMAEGIDAHHTNVFVLLDVKGSFIKTAYGPFRSFNAAKDWGLINSPAFTVLEIMRPIGVETVGFVLTDPVQEPTLEDQGTHPDQAQIGDYIDPNIV